MNTTEQEMNLISVEDAIKISKIISSVSEERIPIILNVLEKAGVNIDGLDELEEWRALKEQAYLIDMDEFVSALIQRGRQENERVMYRPKEFEEICKQFNVKPSCAKRALYRKGLIETTENGGKLNYTVPVWTDGRVERYVIIVNPKAADRKEVPHGKG